MSETHEVGKKAASSGLTPLHLPREAHARLQLQRLILLYSQYCPDQVTSELQQTSVALIFRKQIKKSQISMGH